MHPGADAPVAQGCASARRVPGWGRERYGCCCLVRWGLWHSFDPGCSRATAGPWILYASGCQSSPGAGTLTGVCSGARCSLKQKPITAALALLLPWEATLGRSPAGDTSSFAAPFGQGPWCEGGILEGVPKAKTLCGVYEDLQSPALEPQCWQSAAPCPGLCCSWDTELARSDAPVPFSCPEPGFRRQAAFEGALRTPV